jgi:hypothetical protein
MNTTHTPEPWRVEAKYTNGLLITDQYEDTNICSTGAFHGYSSIQQANAYRIVACVNACAGMENPSAEIERLKAQCAELVMGKADIAMQGADASIQGSDATIQRNTLLRAIKGHLDLYNAGLLTDPHQLEEHTLKLAEIYTDIINS